MKRFERSNGLDTALYKNIFSLTQDGYCNYKNVTAMATMTGFVNVTSGDLNALKIAIAKHGPVSVAMDASHKSLSFYANGVYYEPKCGELSLRIFRKTMLSFGGFPDIKLRRSRD